MQKSEFLSEGKASTKAANFFRHIFLNSQNLANIVSETNCICLITVFAWKKKNLDKLHCVPLWQQEVTAFEFPITIPTWLVKLCWNVPRGIPRCWPDIQLLVKKTWPWWSSYLMSHFHCVLSLNVVCPSNTTMIEAVHLSSLLLVDVTAYIEN